MGFRNKTPGRSLLMNFTFEHRNGNADLLRLENGGPQQNSLFEKVFHHGLFQIYS